jgi:hypothetical protein
MKRPLYLLANFFGGVVLVLLIMDPARPLPSVFILLGLSVGCFVLARLVGR